MFEVRDLRRYNRLFLRSQMDVRNHKVAFKTEADIKRIADNSRNALCGRIDIHDISVTDCIKVLMQSKRIKSTRTGKFTQLGLSFFNQRAGEAPAYVKHDPLNLYCDQEIWRDAELREPNGKFIVAHELGHVIMHSYYVQQFTENTRASPWIKEEQGEWQANTFADYLLVSDYSIDELITPTDIAIFCGVEKQLAQRRLGVLQNTGNNCPRCGSNFVIRRGLTEKCDNCGKRT